MSRSARPWVSMLLAGALGSVPADAQPCRLCGQPSDLAEQGSAVPVTIEVQTNLDFDRLVLTGPTGGTARLGPDGRRAAQGSVSGPGARATVGSVTIRGEPHRMVRVDLPTSIELWGYAGGQIVIERIEADRVAAPRLDASGRLTFRFGGAVRIEGDAQGDYRGDVPITVEYL